MAIFLDEDIVWLVRKFSQTRHSSDALPPLVLASDGAALVARERLKDVFQDEIVHGTERLQISALAKQLGVDQDVVEQLVQHHDGPVWRSIDQKSVVPQNERAAIETDVTGKLSDSLLLKSNLSRVYDMDADSVDRLVERLDVPLLSFDQHICSQSYHDAIFAHISMLLHQSLQGCRAFCIEPQSLPGRPPIWFASQILQNLLASSDHEGRFFIHVETDKIDGFPKRMIEQQRNSAFDRLQSGITRYIELQSLLDDYPDLYTSLEPIQQHAQTISGIEVIDTFLVSGVWISKTTSDYMQILETDGLADLAQNAERDGILPARIEDKIRENIVQSASAILGGPLVCTGSFVLTEPRLDMEHKALCTYAATDAAAQWRQLRLVHDFEIKFQLSNVVAMIKDSELILKALIESKPVQKMADERFWAVVAEKEVENEAEFSMFWTERLSRCYLYNDALNAIEDQKLRGQLAELSAALIQKELLPETIAKARSLGFALSRRTRKNVDRLESKFTVSAPMNDGSSAAMDMCALIAAFEKFSNKQGIELPTPSARQEVKSSMVQDMKRRIQKQRKADGPVLFLTLIIILMANQHAGVIYATGRFAPKLLKQLKAHVPEQLYQKLDKWKEAAKSDTLSAEDRHEMNRLVDG